MNRFQGAGKSKRLLIFVAWAVLGPCSTAVTVGQVPPELTRVRQIHALSPQAADKKLPVHLIGQVTIVSSYKSSFFFMDSTGGLSVERDTPVPELHSGDRVELRGVTDASLFAPIVKSEDVKLLGSGKLPPVRVYHWDELSGGQQDGNWISLRGLVRSVQVQTKGQLSVLLMELDIGGGYLVATSVSDFSGDGWKRLPGELISIRGVCGSAFNDRRQFMGLRLFSPSLDDIKVEKPVPADPFQTPQRAVDSFMVFGDKQKAVERIKVKGVVTLFKPGIAFYIQDGQRGLGIRTSQTDPLVPGQVVEVVGYPAAGRYAPILEDAVYRVVGSAAPVVPVLVPASGMSQTNQFGFRITPFNAQLVQLTGELLEEIPGQSEDQLIVKEGDLVYTARLLLPEPGRIPLPHGTIVRLVGVSVASVDQAHDVRSFELMLRSTADIVVVRRAPWWNAEHAGWVVALCMIGLLLVISVIAFVRYHEQLRKMAMTDSLTDLFNRRGFFLHGERLWQMALRRKTAFLLFYIDIDDFKTINDERGHKAGDHALQAVAELLRKCFRKTDVLARMGGDEFAVGCMAPVDSHECLTARLQEAIDLHNRQDGREFDLNLSVGMFVCNAEHASLKIGDLLRQADTLMYEQKREHKSAKSAT